MALQIGIPRGAKVVPGSATAAAIEAGTVVLVSGPPKRKKAAATKKTKTAEKKPKKPPAPPPARKIVMMRPVAMGTIVPQTKPTESQPPPSVVKIESSEPSASPVENESRSASTIPSTPLSANVDEPEGSRKRKRSHQEDQALKRTKKLVGNLFVCMEDALEWTETRETHPSVFEFYTTVADIVVPAHKQFSDYVRYFEEKE